MYGFVLQDWVTIRANAIAAITQGEPAWMALPSFQDVVFWIDIREFTNPTTGTIVMQMETAPSKDDALFQILTNTNFTISSAAISVKPVLVAGNPAVPLATWVRWKLAPTGSTTAAWDVTFRILVAANMVGRGSAGMPTREQANANAYSPRINR